MKVLSECASLKHELVLTKLALQELTFCDSTCFQLLDNNGDLSFRGVWVDRSMCQSFGKCEVIV